MVQDAIKVNGLKILKKIKNSFTQMDDFTVRYCNKMRSKSVFKTIIIPAVMLILVFWVTNEISSNSLKDWVDNLCAFIALSTAFIVVTYIGTKFISWVTFKIYKHFNEALIPTFFYWLFSVVFGFVITGTVIYVGMIVLITIIIIYLLIFSVFYEFFN